MQALSALRAKRDEIKQQVAKEGARLQAIKSEIEATRGRLQQV